MHWDPDVSESFVSWIKKLQDSYYVVSEPSEGTIYPYVSSESWAQEEVTSEH